jgi:carbon monoxide dehydrogenase subunit G
MELVNDFTVSVPVDEAWKTLTDVERIAPCLPGAQLQEIEGDVYRGVVKVKVGPILAQFKGQATFLERDETNHRAVLKAEGRDTGGKGNASALITAQLDSVDADTTKVTVTTDLTITGKVAQFGRGALADVSTKLLNQFVDQLETTVLRPNADDPAPPAAEAATAAPVPEAATASNNGDPAVRKIEHTSADPVDLVDVAGGAVLKRLAPLAVIGLIVVLILLARRRRGS